MAEPSRTGGWRRPSSIVLLAAAVALAMGQGGGTYAAFSDFQARHVNVGAGSWWVGDLPLIPQACTYAGFVPANWFVITDEGTSWSDGVQPLQPELPPGAGSTPDGAFQGTPDNDFVINFGGKRTLHGKAGDDCMVSGPEGDMLMGEDGYDILIGGKKQHKGELDLPASDVEPPAGPVVMAMAASGGEAVLFEMQDDPTASPAEGLTLPAGDTDEVAPSEEAVTADSAPDGSQVEAPSDAQPDPAEITAAADAAPADSPFVEVGSVLDGGDGVDLCFVGIGDVPISCEAQAPADGVAPVGEAPLSLAEPKEQVSTGGTPMRSQP